MIRQQREQTAGGFTLLEVMIAMAIFSIGILAVVGVQHLVVRGNASGNVVTEQLMLAQRFMEKIKHTPGNDLENLTAGSFSGINADGSPGGPYTVEIKIWKPAGAESRLLSVTVSSAGLHGHTLTTKSMTYGDGV